jgi:hypothetical protein
MKIRYYFKFALTPLKQKEKLKKTLLEFNVLLTAKTIPTKEPTEAENNILWRDKYVLHRVECKICQKYYFNTTLSKHCTEEHKGLYNVLTIC